MIPSVTISKTDGNLGIAAETDRILAIIGTATAGATNTGTALTNKADVKSTFTAGPLVEACCYMIDAGVQVVAFRGSPTTAGSYGTVDSSGIMGTATVAAAGTPAGAYDVDVKIVSPGALGTAGITFIYSLDGGVNWSQETALGTSLTMTLERGVSFTLSSSTSTLLAGDTWSVSTVAPKLTTGDLATSLAALEEYAGEWLRVLVLTEADATILAQLDTFAKSFWPQGKYPEMIACTRIRGGSESRADYLTAMATISSGVQSTEVSGCVDQCEIVSSVDGRRLRMQTSIPFAARTMVNDDSRDAAAKADGALTGVSLVTAGGDRNYHDEARYPGLDALGFTTLRTWGGRPVTPGAYVNNPRLLAGPTSDYQFFQESAILNRAIEMTFSLLSTRLSQSVIVDSSTGKIRENVAKALEDSITADLRTSFQEPGRVSAIQFLLSRTDDVLTTNTLHFTVQLQPLGYVKQFIGKAGLVRTPS